MKLSDKLIELRKAKGWSQEEFAEKMDVSRQAISRWENGTALPDAQNLWRSSRLFGVSADYLLNDNCEEKPEAPAPEAATDAPAADEPAPTVRKKKLLHWFLIPALCLAIAALSVLVTLKIVNDRTPSTPEVHHHSEFVRVIENEVAPTCTSEGSYDEVIYCGTCDEELLRATQTRAKLAHNLSTMMKKNEIAPTCQAMGSYDEIVYCKTCDKAILQAHRITEKIAHQFQNKKCISCGEDQPSDGLLYMSNGNGTCIVDIGSCTDENIVIPSYSPSGEKVIQIKAYAFAGNSSVKSVQIPETVTLIGEGAFQNCQSLESVHLPSRLTRIPSYTFQGCTNLKDVIIPANVYHIGVEAFAECRALKSIVIPASVTKIGKFAFRNFAGGNGTVTFEVYGGWKLYDDLDNRVGSVDFSSHIATPTEYITYFRCEYHWKRDS